MFAAPYERAQDGVLGPLGAPVAMAPEGLIELVADGRGASSGPWLLVGDGAIRYRERCVAGLEAADGSPLHRVSGAAICDLGAVAVPTPRGGGARRPTTSAGPTRSSPLEGA